AAEQDQMNSQLRDIGRDLETVRGLSSAIAEMVNEQGEQIDQFADLVDDAADEVSDGVEDLEGAQTYQKKANKKGCWITIILIIVIVIAALMLVKTFV
ncbi:hypothetical protein KIPB_007083, partial [Kipferlia bialata]